jgi:hypothetical protein
MRVAGSSALGFLGSWTGRPFLDRPALLCTLGAAAERAALSPEIGSALSQVKLPRSAEAGARVRFRFALAVAMARRPRDWRRRHLGDDHGAQSQRGGQRRVRGRDAAAVLLRQVSVRPSVHRTNECWAAMQTLMQQRLRMSSCRRHVVMQALMTAAHVVMSSRVAAHVVARPALCAIGSCGMSCQ